MYLDNKVEEKLSKRLCDAEKNLLYFQEIDEALFDQFHQIQMNENLSEGRLRYMKDRQLKIVN